MIDYLNAGIIIPALKQIPSYPAYWVSSNGECLINRGGKYKHTPRRIKLHTDNGYIRTCIWLYDEDKRKGVWLHRLVYEAWVGPIPSGMWINHIDGNRSNNDVSNLELQTPKKNHWHAREYLRRDRPLDRLLTHGQKVTLIDAVKFLKS